MESRESSSPIVTRAVAAALAGKQIDSYTFSAFQRIGLRLLGNLPQQAAQWMIPRAQTSSALDPRQVRNVSIEKLVSDRLQDYKNLAQRKWPAITAGIALGGTTAHLAAALHAPFLPQAFVLTLKNGSNQGRVQQYFERSRDLAWQIAENNPGCMTIQHFDPVHDGWLTRRVNHLRIKLIDLPEGYRTFIRQNLQKGGEVIYLDGGARWLQYRTGSRSVFQVGGWGDISASEFLEGSPRLTDYCRKERLAECGWQLADYPLEEGFESEWGSEPGLGEALERFCLQEGYQFTPISLPEPNSFSRLAFFAYQRLLDMEHRQPAGVLVEMFSQFNVSAALQCGLLPLWLIFNTADSARFLQQMTEAFPRNVPVFFSPLATFSITPDMMPWKGWEDILRPFTWVNIGARRSHYPADARALLDWAKPLHDWCRSHYQPIESRLTGLDLVELVQLLDSKATII